MNLLARLFGRQTSDTADWLEATELAALLKSPSPPVVVDVRGPGEFTGPLGHIASARNIPLDQLPNHITKLVAEPRALVLVCHSDRRSSAAAKLLRRAGRTKVAVLRGGMMGWQA
ncbi:MAG TPA: rhodanese [Acetobacteraceae bacterium]|jgi:rhodanese-related sulfurtransferase|nr:rhodanese [Acetobacteraceae bacterium]